jgi:hypothetical protein
MYWGTDVCENLSGEGGGGEDDVWVDVFEGKEEEEDEEDEEDEEEGEGSSGGREEGGHSRRALTSEGNANLTETERLAREEEEKR